MIDLANDNGYNLICSSCTKCFAVGAMAHLCQTEGSRHLPTHRGPVVDVDLTLTLAVVIVVMEMQQIVMIGFFFSLNKRPVAVSAPAGHTG